MFTEEIRENVRLHALAGSYFQDRKSTIGRPGWNQPDTKNMDLDFNGWSSCFTPTEKELESRFLQMSRSATAKFRKEVKAANEREKNSSRSSSRFRKTDSVMSSLTAMATQLRDLSFVDMEEINLEKVKDSFIPRPNRSALLRMTSSASKSQTIKPTSSHSTSIPSKLNEHPAGNSTSCSNTQSMEMVDINRIISISDYWQKFQENSYGDQSGTRARRKQMLDELTGCIRDPQSEVLPDFIMKNSRFIGSLENIQTKSPGFRSVTPSTESRFNDPVQVTIKKDSEQSSNSMYNLLARRNSAKTIAGESEGNTPAFPRRRFSLKSKSENPASPDPSKISGGVFSRRMSFSSKSTPQTPQTTRPIGQIGTPVMDDKGVIKRRDSIVSPDFKRSPASLKSSSKANLLEGNRGTGADNNIIFENRTKGSKPDLSILGSPARSKETKTHPAFVGPPSMLRRRDSMATAVQAIIEVPSNEIKNGAGLTKNMDPQTTGSKRSLLIKVADTENEKIKIDTPEPTTPGSKRRGSIAAGSGTPGQLRRRESISNGQSGTQGGTPSTRKNADAPGASLSRRNTFAKDDVKKKDPAKDELAESYKALRDEYMEGREALNSTDKKTRREKLRSINVRQWMVKFCLEHNLSLHPDLIRPSKQGTIPEIETAKKPRKKKTIKRKRLQVPNRSRKVETIVDKSDGVYDHEAVVAVLKKVPHERTKQENEKLFKCIKNLKAFSKLSAFVLKELCGVMRHSETEKEIPVFLQGEVGTCWYVILKGKVDIKISKTGKLEDSKSVVELSAGAGFGDLALVNDKPRSATVQAITDCEFAKVEKVDYDRILRFIHDNECKEKAIFMKRLKFFESWNVEALKSVVDVIKWKTFPAKSYIIEEGQPWKEVIIVKKGIVQLQQQMKVEDFEARVPIQDFKEGEFFGEPVLTSDEIVAPFSLYAATDVEIAVVNTIDALSHLKVHEMTLSKHGETNQTRVLLKFRKNYTEKQWKAYVRKYRKQLQKERYNKSDIRSLPPIKSSKKSNAKKPDANSVASAPAPAPATNPAPAPATNPAPAPTNPAPAPTNPAPATGTNPAPAPSK